ncbi:hypothetical protein ACLN6N_11660 [Sphingomonas carotinifaciens]|uniref:Uncharacterized protein n=1 Tax=Sphingomonas carotinifaciens TaxID=1166323 RepID=A0A1G7GQG5_9SPHN|nr:MULTISPECIES: hypothetical protein [Sphingomonas]MBB4086628.1 hypothetical protein [Sphingomonas carotinifaciens]MWC42977.1 hypothetical protein [Sphingomonas carotinifaciens]SDE90418.1 hypothetical protein SAMN05216557_101987 [Sphingomonas carotinifaciens]
MRSLIKSSFLWQFAGGFVLGAISLAAFHTAEAVNAPTRAPVEAIR